MEREKILRNIKTFKHLMGTVNRPGKDDLMAFLEKSDFYTAPASTKFHMSTEGGLLQHSLNVYASLTGNLVPREGGTEKWAYMICGEEVAEYDHETLVIVSLLHDLCKTNFYATEMRNQKTYDPDRVSAAPRGSVKRDNGGAFVWEQVPCYTIDDRNPYGHGEKSVMMVEEFMKLRMEERYAIRWHMGTSDCSYNQIQSFYKSVEKFPICLLLHMADEEASHFIEDKNENKKDFTVEFGFVPEEDEEQTEPVFEEAAPAEA